MAVTEERMIDVEDGAHIAYEVRSDHPSGLPILALHGVLVGTSNWIHQMLRLPQFNWIAPAIRGHGDSSPAGDSPSIERAALDALAVLDAEGIDRAVVVGNSLGATVGLALALLRPERVIALVLAEPSVPQLLRDRGGDRLSSAAEHGASAAGRWSNRRRTRHLSDAPGRSRLAQQGRATAPGGMAQERPFHPCLVHGSRGV